MTERRIFRPIWALSCVGLVTALTALPMAGTASAATSTPCKSGVTACVSLGKSGYNAHAWLSKGGKVARGPLDATSGGPGMDTPPGTYRVTSKDEHHKASATGADMPYSVFFGNSGLAFHGGTPRDPRTAGCIRLANSDAAYFFNNLKIGDTVQIVQGDGSVPDDDDKPSKGGGGLLGL
ncbi:L,D-transpeptidase [Pseudonocardia spinosispora]|uniref:L,D-transpeptidase n=1 Tax=Pseudonocardia spinosispora TaxID=103441 RepID=UPI000686ADB6|nr:L,D-transpeptidase [Pseudonocardia spinosispora]